MREQKEKKREDISLSTIDHITSHKTLSFSLLNMTEVFFSLAHRKSRLEFNQISLI